jgi:hypothetical protein
MIENVKVKEEILKEEYSQEERIIIFRDANQRYLLNLYNLNDAVKNLENDKAFKIYNLLVGSSFSLWRAAFLTTDNRSEKDTFDNGVKVLINLIKHNSINYSEEFRQQNWVMGFYLNNSKLRILQVMIKLKKYNVQHAIDFNKIEELSLTKITDMNIAWVILHNAMVDIFFIMKTVANKKQKL